MAPHRTRPSRSRDFSSLSYPLITTTRAEWKAYFYADISAQLRRHGVNHHLFDGLYLNKTSITGSWLLVELVSTSQTLAYQNVTLKNSA